MNNYIRPLTKFNVSRLLQTELICVKWKGKQPKIKFVTDLLELIFDSALVSFKFRNPNCEEYNRVYFFKQTVGICTGLVCAVQVANLFLYGLDVVAKKALNCCIASYTRFVDDIMVITTKRIDIEVFLGVLNSWASGIVITHDHSENGEASSFLDLFVMINNKLDVASIDFKTFAKPLNLYMYTPFISNHAPSCFKAIASGEFLRVCRTCSSVEYTFVQLQKMVQKF